MPRHGYILTAAHRDDIRAGLLAYHARLRAAGLKQKRRSELSYCLKRSVQALPPDAMVLAWVRSQVAVTVVELADRFDVLVADARDRLICLRDGGSLMRLDGDDWCYWARWAWASS